VSVGPQTRGVGPLARLRGVQFGRRGFINMVRNSLAGVDTLLRWLATRPPTADVPSFTRRTRRFGDRAEVATTAILQIIETAPMQEWGSAIENHLRDEFSDAERQAAADRGSTDA
jgi:hypothetical protein